MDSSLKYSGSASLFVIESFADLGHRTDQARLAEQILYRSYISYQTTIVERSNLTFTVRETNRESLWLVRPSLIAIFSLASVMM